MIGNAEAQICVMACSKSPEGASRRTMQAIMDELIRLEVVYYIPESIICDVMKKKRLTMACKGMVHPGDTY